MDIVRRTVVHMGCAAATALLIVACGSSNSPAQPTTTVGGSSGPCDPQANPASGPVTDPNGPLYHQVVLATTADDGATVAGAVQILTAASVPDGTLLPDGSVGVYYVNGNDNSIWLARVSGSTAAAVGPITLNGLQRPFAADPDATLLSNGRIRLVYLQSLMQGGIPRSRAICVAESGDGLNFDVVGTALNVGASSTDTDPSVTRLSSGAWLMGLSRGTLTELASSSDGVTFNLGATLAYGGVPEVATLADGRVRLWVCGGGGIESYISADSGANWTREGVVVPNGTLGRAVVCDPSRVAGTNLFLFKTQ